MMLYHGTNGAWLDRILKTGLKPRGLSGGRSNWNHTVRSNPRCVYLTDSYAPYFAFNAARGKDPLCAVVEIDTDRLDHGQLFPDEDFLEQCSRRIEGAVPGDMRTRTLHYRKEQFSYDWPCEVGDGTFTTWWENSLRFLGTCSHRGIIPASAITRAVVWPHTALLLYVWDPTISIMNQRILGDRYRALTAKLMAGQFSTPEEMGAAAPQSFFTEPLLPVIEGWRVVENNPK